MKLAVLRSTLPTKTTPRLASEAKRILYVNPTADISGGENSLLMLLQALDRSDYEPLLVCPAQGRLTQRAQAADIPYQIQHLQSLSLNGSPMEIIADLSRALAAASSWRAFIQENHIDLAHVNSYRIAIACSIGARLARRPVVWHVRDIPVSSFKRYLVRTLALNLADRVLAVSDAVAQIFERGNQRPSSVQVIYNGVDLQAFRPTVARNEMRAKLGIAPDTVLVGSFGQLVPWKGYELLLRALVRLQATDLNIQVLIAGESISPGFRLPAGWHEYNKQLLQLCHDLSLDGSVQFLGFREDIPNLLNALDIYAHCAIRPDPLPRSILEAMAIGKAIIAPHSGGVPELVSDRKSGWLYPAGDVQALSAGIMTLARNSDLRAELGHAARTRCVTNFSREQHIQQVQAVYQEVLYARRN